MLTFSRSGNLNDSFRQKLFVLRDALPFINFLISLDSFEIYICTCMYSMKTLIFANWKMSKVDIFFSILVFFGSNFHLKMTRHWMMKDFAFSSLKKVKFCKTKLIFGRSSMQILKYSLWRCCDLFLLLWRLFSITYTSHLWRFS